MGRMKDKLIEALERGVEDVVNQPAHYCLGGMETIDYIESRLTPQEFKGFLKGNMLKYMSRANYKESEKQDLAKAHWYSSVLQEWIENNATSTF